MLSVWLASLHRKVTAYSSRDRTHEDNDLGQVAPIVGVLCPEKEGTGSPLLKNLGARRSCWGLRLHTRTMFNLRNLAWKTRKMIRQLARRHSKPRSCSSKISHRHFLSNIQYICIYHWPKFAPPKKTLYTSRFVRVILAQGPGESSLYRSNFIGWSFTVQGNKQQQAPNKLKLAQPHLGRTQGQRSNTPKFAPRCRVWGDDCSFDHLQPCGANLGVFEVLWRSSRNSGLTFSQDIPDPYARMPKAKVKTFHTVVGAAETRPFWRGRPLVLPRTSTSRRALQRNLSYWKKMFHVSYVMHYLFLLVFAGVVNGCFA